MLENYIILNHKSQDWLSRETDQAGGDGGLCRHCSLDDQGQLHRLAGQPFDSHDGPSNFMGLKSHICHGFNCKVLSVNE